MKAPLRRGFLVLGTAAARVGGADFRDTTLDVMGQRTAAPRAVERRGMSVQFDSSRSRWVVRWYDAGRRRSRRGHLELNLFTEALAHTDDAIRAATTQP